MADYDSDERWSKKKFLSNAVRLVILCISWYLLSAGENIISKIILTDFPYPLTASVSHSVFIAVVLGPILRVWKVPPNPTYRKKYYFYVIVPLAFGKVMASFTSQFSLSKVPVSYAHTVKASMPIFTVILSRLILKERNSWKTMKDIGMHHLRLLHQLCKIGVAFLVPVWLFTDVVKWTSHDVVVQSPGALMLLFLIDCFCNFAHGMVAFTIISMISPLSYSVANATKRIVVITMSLLTLKNPVTSTNVLGMSIAICGVLLYNKVKLDQVRKKEILPTRSTTSLYQLAGDRNSSVKLNHESLAMATLVPMDNAYPHSNHFANSNSAREWFDSNRTSHSHNGHIPSHSPPDFPKHRYQHL